ncbi:MAG: prepilin-type N-terminal cleavage/methylation domain-containing protein [Thermoanaerobaculia bacterium]|nr:prepilin-type N-terminal cleavage/methylation domain-containing protein [Thermoanaerobaculia bacterium]
MRTCPPAPVERGFSLLEALVASALLLMIVVGVLPLFTRATIDNLTGFEASQIANLARSQMERCLEHDFDHPEMSIPTGRSRRETVEHYSAAARRWKTGSTAAGGDRAVWVRTTTVRQYHVSALSDGELEESEALPGGAPAEHVHLKEITVRLDNRAGGSVARPTQTITLRLFKSQ